MQLDHKPGWRFRRRNRNRIQSGGINLLKTQLNSIQSKLHIVYLFQKKMKICDEELREIMQLSSPATFRGRTSLWESQPYFFFFNFKYRFMHKFNKWSLITVQPKFECSSHFFLCVSRLCLHKMKIRHFSDSLKIFMI